MVNTPISHVLSSRGGVRNFFTTRNPTEDLMFLGNKDSLYTEKFQIIYLSQVASNAEYAAAQLN